MCNHPVQYCTAVFSGLEAPEPYPPGGVLSWVPDSGWALSLTLLTSQASPTSQAPSAPPSEDAELLLSWSHLEDPLPLMWVTQAWYCCHTETDGDTASPVPTLSPFPAIQSCPLPEMLSCRVLAGLPALTLLMPPDSLRLSLPRYLEVLERTLSLRAPPWGVAGHLPSSHL